MDEITKNEIQTEEQKLTRIYDNDEELKQLKVLATVFKKFDLKRLGDVALGVLQVNPDNLIANKLYGLEIKKHDKIDEIAFNDFNTYIMEDLFKKISEVNGNFDEESKLIIIEILCGFAYLLSEYYDCKQNELTALFKCFKSLKPDGQTLTSFYRYVLTVFCNPNVINTLSNYADYDYSTITGERVRAGEILKTRKYCLIYLKQFVERDSVLGPDAKKPLIAQIENTGLIAPPQTQANAQSNTPAPNAKGKIAIYVGIGIFAVCIVFYLISLLF